MTIASLNRVLSAAIGMCALAAAMAIAGEVPTIENPWVPEAPPGATMHAGYFTLHNLAATPVELVGVASPQYHDAQIHLSKVESGVASMVRQYQIAIPPGGVLKMAPGGFHVMLMHPMKPLKTGDTVEFNLSFADGSTLSFKAPVRKGGGMMHMHHQSDKMN